MYKELYENERAKNNTESSHEKKSFSKDMALLLEATSRFLEDEKKKDYSLREENRYLRQKLSQLEKKLSDKSNN